MSCFLACELAHVFMLVWHACVFAAYVSSLRFVPISTLWAFVQVHLSACMRAGVAGKSLRCCVCSLGLCACTCIHTYIQHTLNLCECVPFQGLHECIQRVSSSARCGASHSMPGLFSRTSLVFTVTFMHSMVLAWALGLLLGIFSSFMCFKLVRMMCCDGKAHLAGV